MAVVAGVLLASVPTVSANHVASAKGAYAVTPEVVFRLHLVVATEGLDVFQAEWVPTGGSVSVQATRINAFAIAPAPAGRTVTLTGELVSTTILGAGATRQPFAELVPFTATGVDTVTPGAGPDTFSLTLAYRADQAQGPFFASFGLGACDATTCTITFAGPLTEGDLFVHLAG
jgi:hypothetical protein